MSKENAKNPDPGRGKSRNADRRKTERQTGGRGRKTTDSRCSPLISIITICYNAEKEIAPTVSSVERQTFKDYEHLIIDGSSTDSTIAVARLNGSKKMRILSEPDEGLYDAMNKGLAMARGKYVLFLNAGDAFHADDTLASYAKEIEEKDPDIIYGDTVIVDSERNYLRPRHLSVPETLTARSFSRGMLICHQSFMVRRNLAPEYDLSYRFSADYDWTLKCINASRPGKRVNLGRVVTDYLDNGLTDKNKVKSLQERFRIMKKNFGLPATIVSHLSFIPRAVGRRLVRRR